MKTRLFAIVTAIALSCGLVPAAVAGEAVLSKVPSKGVTFNKKAGYWTECHYSGLGTVCETVYMRAKNGKFRAVPVGAARLKHKAGQVQVCYWGNNNSEICYWAYSPRRKM